MIKLVVTYIITQIAEVLLAHGANPSLKNANYETPAHAAARAGNLAMLKFLVEKG